MRNTARMFHMGTSDDSIRAHARVSGLPAKAGIEVILSSDLEPGV